MTTAALPKLPKLTARQEGGDDGYCWAVRRDGYLVTNGLMRSQVSYYKRVALQVWCEKNGVDYEAAKLKLKL